MSTFPNRRWLIIPSSLVESLDFTSVLENSIESLRYSIDGSKTFVKYEIQEVLEDQTNTIINGETGEEETHTILAGIYGRPSIYSEEYSEYTHEGILTLLATGEWTTPLEQTV